MEPDLIKTACKVKIKRKVKDKKKANLVLKNENS